MYKAVATHQILETLRKDLLDPTNNEKIVANPHEACLTIHSRKSTVSIILARLDEFAKSIVSQDISTHNIKRENLSRSALKDLGRLTETALTYEANKQASFNSAAPNRRNANNATDSHGVLDGQSRSPAAYRSRSRIG